MNCWVVPRAIIGVCGVMAIDTRAAGFTTSGAEALTDPELIPIVVVPVPRDVASPAVAAVLLMVATVAAVELQCPVWVTSCVVPSVKVPVAVNGCVMPSGIVAAGGAIEVAEKLGATPNRPVIFECVGVPGMLDGVIASAPLFSRVVVVGVCMEPDRLRPAMAINKEIELRFVVGYTPLEFRDTLMMLAEGKVDAARIVTGTVGLGGVDGAFDALGDPEAQAKVLIDPKSSAILPTPA